MLFLGGSVKLTVESSPCKVSVDSFLSERAKLLGGFLASPLVAANIQYCQNHYDAHHKEQPNVSVISSCVEQVESTTEEQHTPCPERWLGNRPCRTVGEQLEGRLSLLRWDSEFDSASLNGEFDFLDLPPFPKMVYHGLRNRGRVVSARLVVMDGDRDKRTRDHSLFTFESRQPQTRRRISITAPISTEPRARVAPPGPEPKTIGNGPMKITPPVETFPWAAVPNTRSPIPARRITRPTASSFCKAYTM